MSKERIMIVEDEESIQELIKYNLQREGYLVPVCCENGESALESAVTYKPDLILLDLMLPGVDGLTVCKNLKADPVTKHIPVIMLTAKSEESDVVIGLELGADDYITKPFDTDELLARIRALLRRKEKFTGDILRYGDIYLDRDSAELGCGEKKITLGKKEFQILEMLMLNVGKSIDKERFIEKIWGYDTEAEYNTIEVYVSFLRKKLLAVGSKTEIRSLRGIGYTLGEKNG